MKPNKKILIANLDFFERFLKKYKENQLAGKSFYYEEKLKFSPNEKERITKIFELSKNYIEGIQFVLLYYFEGCPSWDWFYPYYYSPMISDIYEYIKYMNSNNIKNPDFQLSRPFDAFKQLLLVMPLESIALLPDEFSNLVTNSQSILRNPFDYYPENFEIDPNDAYYESEFIAVLPFLGNDLLEKAYQGVDQSQMKKELKERNSIGKNIVYSYNRKAYKIAVSSFLPNICPNFNGKIKKTEFFFDEIKEDSFYFDFIESN